MEKKKTRLLRFTFCDFCGAGASDRAVLIQGRDLVHICNQCVKQCAEMLIEEAAQSGPKLTQPGASAGETGS